MAWQIDLDGLTIGDTEDLLEALGIGYNDLGKIGDVEMMTRRVDADGKRWPSLLQACAWLAKRHEDPSFTIEMARDLPIQQLAEMFGDPNAGAAEAASSISTARSPKPSGTRRQRSGVSR